MVVAGDAIHGDGILGLQEIITKETWRTGTGAERPAAPVLPAYREAIVSRHRLARPVKAVVDCGNGVASLVAADTLRALGVEVTALFCESDGTFPNHHPHPTLPEHRPPPHPPPPPARPGHPRRPRAGVPGHGGRAGHRLRRGRGPDRRGGRIRRD